MSFLQASMGGGSSSLSDLNDVNITSPQDRDMLIYDAENSKWINETPMIQVNLTINGAKEDIIAVYDSNNNLVGSCIFESGQTSGNCNINVPDSGGYYKFVSSVAKNINSSGNEVDYEKTILLSAQSRQTVNVYPDNILYWYGSGIMNSWRKGYTGGSNDAA